MFLCGHEPGKVEQFAICPYANQHAPIEHFVHSLQHSFEVPLLHAMVDYKGITEFTADCDLYLHFIVELLDDVYKLIRLSIDFKDLPEGCAVNFIKCLCEINKDNIR